MLCAALDRLARITPHRAIKETTNLDGRTPRPAAVQNQPEDPQEGRGDLHLDEDCGDFPKNKISRSGANRTLGLIRVGNAYTLLRMAKPRTAGANWSGNLAP
jgi:hypothetical protein